jgi:hypothetical protein
VVEGKSFRLADEVRYIHERATEHHEQVVSFGQIVLFSTETGDAWLLDAYNSPHGWRATGILSRSTSRIPKPLSRSSGRVNSASKHPPDRRRVTTIVGYPTQLGANRIISVDWHGTQAMRRKLS